MQNDATKGLSKVIRIDESEIRSHLDKMARGTVEETLNTLLDAEADEMCNAQRYERSPDREDTRAGSYRRNLHTKAGEVERGFQARTTAEGRSTNRKRRTLRRFEQIHTLRYRFLNRAGLLVHPNVRATLDVGNNTKVRDRFEANCRGLAKAA